MLRVIVLAAGFGTRLYPLAKNKPKALLDLGGRTLLDHLMEKLESLSVVRDVVVVTNGLFYNELLRWQQRSRYQKRISIENNHVFVPEKRCGAVQDLFLGFRSKRTGSDDFLVLCADNYFDFPLGHFLLPCLGHGQSGFIGMYDVKDIARAQLYGVVELDNHNKVISFHEKPAEPKSTYASIGIYYFPYDYLLRVYEYLNIECLNADRIGDFVGWLSTKEELYGVQFDGCWFDIGDLESYEEAKKQFGYPMLKTED